MHFKVLPSPLLITDSLSLKIYRAESLTELPTVLIGDQVRLQQVLANLLKNALRYSRTAPIYIFAAFDKQAQKLIV